MNAHQRRVQARRLLHLLVKGRLSGGTMVSSDFGHKQLRDYMDRIAYPKKAAIVHQILELGGSRKCGSTEMRDCLHGLNPAEWSMLHWLVGWGDGQSLEEAVTLFLLAPPTSTKQQRSESAPAAAPA